MEPAVRLVIDAVIVSVRELTPRVLTLVGARPRLPSGDFRPDDDRTLELAARRLVAEQTGLRVGYLEQLYTFGNRFRGRAETEGGPRLVSVGYLALVGADAAAGAGEHVTWEDWYRFFPWEDVRRSTASRADLMDRVAEQVAERDDREAIQRARIAFGLEAAAWNNEAVLERYELLYRLGGVSEAPDGTGKFGEPMDLDHRRILATAIARIRGKIAYRPIVFELMPQTFTLTELQRTVEALAGLRFHTPNFRRLVEETRLVERTGERRRTMGRPAETYRFRPDVLWERPDPGIAIR